MSTRILGSVVLYNPSEDVVSNILTYASYVSGLLIIDNSDKSSFSSEELNRLFPDAILLKNEQNLGIAMALNQAALHAVKQKYDWVLTMDQDSKFSEDSIVELVKAIDQYRGKVGMFTPVHVNKDTQVKPSETPFSIVKKTMTSGNLLNIDAYQECGPFDEKLFIDYVDHEYNFRLQKNGFPIVRVNHSLLIHNLGNIESYRSGVFSIKTTNHNVIRRYYITRNRLYVIFKYFFHHPKFFIREIRHYWTDIFRVIILEQDKINKIKAIIRGTWHWMIGKFGRQH